jgi:hypothetical protein
MTHVSIIRITKGLGSFEADLLPSLYPYSKTSNISLRYTRNKSKRTYRFEVLGSVRPTD